MQYLLDTHTLLWTLFSPQKLPKEVRGLLEDTNTRIAVSVISLWEISLKFRLGKLVFDNFDPRNLPKICQRLQIQILPLTAEEAAGYHLLKAEYHRDPFDRMLIHQAIVHGWTLLSGDEAVARYTCEGLKILWR